MLKIPGGAASANLLQTKQHFQILDGLRGVAAISVLVFHFMEFAVPDYEKSFIAHAYLAVDFFFCLSGFVIAYAYDTRLKEIGTWTFFKLRLIRLHPLVIIGSVIGLLSFVFDPFSNLFAKYGTGKTVLMFLASCFMVPYALIKERYFNNFHLNPPSWSLFWEYIANIFYALIIIRLRNVLLWIITAIAAGLICYEAYTNHYIGVGWDGLTFWGGGARVLYSFLIGIMVYRSKWIIKSRLGLVGLSILLVFAFLIPFRPAFNYITDSVVVILYFPFIMALGAGATVAAKLNKLCKFLGDISYPLYMIHYPFLWLLYSYMEKYKPTLGTMSIVIPVGTLLLIGLAYLIMTYIDIPIRKYLKNRMEKATN